MVSLINCSAFPPSHLGSMTQCSMMMFTKGWQHYCVIGKIPIRWLLLFITWHLPFVSLILLPSLCRLWRFIIVSFFSFFEVFLAMMAPQQIQQLLSPNQLQALIHQKQQALLLQQVFITSINTATANIQHTVTILYLCRCSSVFVV